MIPTFCSFYIRWLKMLKSPSLSIMFKHDFSLTRRLKLGFILIFKMPKIEDKYTMAILS